ncbi:MAG: hypothetical protein AB7O54_01255 [Pseudomonadales bacterium]
MNRRAWFLLPILLACLTAAAADSDAGRFDPRNHDDLNTVIFLCATEPASPRFDAAWTDWLARNPDADVDAAIESVLSRAGTVRSMAIPGMAPAKPGSRPDPEAIADYMAALAGKLQAAGR